MTKNIFEIWNKKKQNTNFLGKYPHFDKGEIWWAQIGQNIATEVAGKGNDFLRPVIILQRVYENACLAIPLTSQKRQGNYYFYFPDSNGINQCALLTQLRYLDGKRLKYQISSIKKEDFEDLRTALFSLIKK